MTETSAGPKQMTLCPEYGSPWGLWSDDPPLPAFRGEHLHPDHFQLSAELRERLGSWLSLWRDNYADVREEESNTWKRGFDRISWGAEGDAIAAAMENELPGYAVGRDYRTYLKSPTR